MQGFGVRVRREEDWCLSKVKEEGEGWEEEEVNSTL